MRSSCLKDYAEFGILPHLLRIEDGRHRCLWNDLPRFLILKRIGKCYLSKFCMLYWWAGCIEQRFLHSSLNERDHLMIKTWMSSLFQFIYCNEYGNITHDPVIDQEEWIRTLCFVLISVDPNNNNLYIWSIFNPAYEKKSIHYNWSLQRYSMQNSS